MHGRMSPSGASKDKKFECTNLVIDIEFINESEQIKRHCTTVAQADLQLD